MSVATETLRLGRPPPAGKARSGRAVAGHSKFARFVPGYLLLTLVTSHSCSPFTGSLSGCSKPPAEQVHTPPLWLPQHWTVSNFRGLFATQGSNLLTYAENTLIICAATVVFSLVSSGLAAYGFSQYHFRGRDALFWTVILTLILPSWATIIPQFQLFTWLHWVGTLNPLIIRTCSGIRSLFSLCGSTC